MVFFQNLFFLLRISHWSKAIFVFLGVIYSQSFDLWPQALLTALAFSFIASAVYIYNDIQDLSEDKVHPTKSHRPLASGKISMPMAISILVGCLCIGFVLAVFVSNMLLKILVTYLLINLLYNHGLRRMPFFDVLCIASGFMLRILAGTIGIGLPMTWWLTATATLLSLLIALGKRRLEIQMNKKSHRSVLKKYNIAILDSLIILTAGGCFISYLLYILYAHEHSYFLLTLPFTAFGLWRFASLSTQKDQQGDPVSLFLTDSFSCLNFLCFSLFTLMALMNP